MFVVWGLPYGIFAFYDFLLGQEFLPNSYPTLGGIIPNWLPPIWIIIGVIAFIVVTFEGSFRIVRQKSRIGDSIQPIVPQGTPRVASPELHFGDIDYNFIGDNPPLLLIQFDVMPTGIMHLEQAKLEILGDTISFADWEPDTINPGVTFGFTNHCEIKGKLSTGNHDIRILVYANRQWWASDWQTITYQPSTLGKEDSQTE